jgi:membrane associated rhomboid family serine protease
VDIPAFMFLFIWIGMQVASQTLMSRNTEAGGVAYLAHIAGFVAGAVLIFVFRRKDPRDA